VEQKEILEGESAQEDKREFKLYAFDFDASDSKT